MLVFTAIGYAIKTPSFGVEKGGGGGGGGGGGDAGIDHHAFILWFGGSCSSMVVFTTSLSQTFMRVIEQFLADPFVQNYFLLGFYRETPASFWPELSWLFDGKIRVKLQLFLV